VLNLTNGSSETLSLNNGTKIVHVKVNYITSTGAGVTVNNQTFNLTLNNPVAFIDPNSYTYYVELTGISYLHTITLLIYGQPNQPIFVPAAPANATAANTPAQEQPSTSITPTTIPASIEVAPTPKSNTGQLLVAAILIIAVIVFCLIYYRNKGGRKTRKRR
jgi:hypothetical protein